MKRTHLLFCAVMAFSALSLLRMEEMEAASPVSSPEGTLTDYVLAKETTVFPPRSMRAQKVEFDTPAKQMIHEPDTPFRQFFNSHAPDFQEGKLDYAKTTILGDTISMLRNKRFIRDMVEEVVNRHKEKAFLLRQTTKENEPPSAEELALMNRKAELYVSAVALALERENYPDLRDDDILEVLTKIDDLDGPLSNSGEGDAVEKQNRKIYQTIVNTNSLNASSLLGWDLRQALRERRYFSNIIDRAVSQRTDLFRTTSSPVEPMRSAQEAVKLFLQRNLGEEHTGDFAELKLSLWEALMEWARTNETVVKPSSNNAPLSTQELRVVSDRLLSTILACLKTNQNVAGAVATALGENRSYLKSESITANTFLSNAATALKTDEQLIDLRNKLEEPTKAAKTAKDQLTTVELTAKTALDNFDAARADGAGKLGTFGSLLEACKTPKALWPATNLVWLDKSGSNLLMVIERAHGLIPTNDANIATNAATVHEKLGGIKTQLEAIRKVDIALSNDWMAANQLAGAAAEYQALSSSDLERIRTNALVLAEGRAKFTNSPIVETGVSTALETVKSDLVIIHTSITNVANSLTNTDAGNELNSIAKSIQEEAIDAIDGIKNNAKVIDGMRTTALGAFPSDALKDAYNAVAEKAQVLQSTNAVLKIKQSNYAGAGQKFDAESAPFQKRFIEVLGATAAKEKDPLLVATIKAYLPNANDWLKKEMLTAREGNQTEFFTLTALANAVLKVDGVADTSASEKEFISAFTRVFDGVIELLPSKDPILIALLKSSRVRFSSEGYRAMAIQVIPRVFKDRLDKQGTPKKPVTAIEEALEAPEVTYLFGGGEVNKRAAEAFKAEFYNAFKHRLAEALKAEREADYDYWWLTFYPKAIAVGQNKFQGDSVLQVNFHENMVPSEQYHRWLQDQYLSGDTLEACYQQKVRLASAVLGDFLVVLDASNLSDRYPELRESIQEAISTLTRRNPQGKKDEPAEMAAPANFHSAMEFLFKRAAMRETNRMHALLSGVQHYVGRNPKTNENVECFEGMKAKVFEHVTNMVEVTIARTSIWKSIDKTLRLYNGAITNTNSFTVLSNVVSHYKTDAIPEFIKLGRIWFSEGNRALTRGDLESNLESIRVGFSEVEQRARYGLAWQSFDERHVAFAVLAAIAKGATLPEKVEVYANAFFNGSRRFTLDPTDLDEQALHRQILDREVVNQLRFEKYVVPFEDVVQQFDMARYLLMKGVSRKAVAQMLFNYHDVIIKGHGMGWDMSRSIKDLIKKLDPWNDFVLPERSGIASKLMVSDALKEVAKESTQRQRQMSREIFRGVEYNAESKRNKYLDHAVLWPLEKDLDETQELLRFVTVSLYHSSYPAIPSLERIRADFLQHDGRLRSLVYFMVRDLYYEYYEREILQEGPTDPGALTIGGEREAELYAKLDFNKIYCGDEAKRASKDAKELYGRWRQYTEMINGNARGYLKTILDETKNLAKRDRENAIKLVKTAEDAKSEAKEAQLAHTQASQMAEETRVIAKNAKMAADAAKKIDEKAWAAFAEAQLQADKSRSEANRLGGAAATKAGLRADLDEATAKNAKSTADQLRKRAIAAAVAANEAEKAAEDAASVAEVKANAAKEADDDYKKAKTEEEMAIRVAQQSDKMMFHTGHLLRFGEAPAVDPRLAARAKDARQVLATLLLDRHPYLTDDARRHFLEVVTEHRSIFEWIDQLAANQRIMDQFSENLLPTLYQPYFASLDKLNKIERQPVEFEHITERDFERFRYRNKPYLQRGIQIVDMLPASRDDLVSLSINQGGMVAKIAAQAEGSAAYDLNMFQSALRNVEALSLGQEKSVSSLERLVPDEAMESIGSLQESARRQKLTDLSSLKQAAGMNGYTLGASARGSLYARAQSAYAYARRREYLDAAITAAGRGDNFAKWVIRESNLESSKAGTDSRKLVASAHNGQPNGDQPFHLLVKIPRAATHMDWDGRNYIFFNSSYTATARKSAWRNCGWLGIVGKVPITIINHNWWSEIEKTTVSSVFPFTWNVQRGDSARKLQELVTTPSILGVKVHLDDTDKIRYSEVNALLDAEANFIQLARQTQAGALDGVMDQIEAESGAFRNEVRQSITNRMQEVRSTQDARKAAENLEAKQKQLEEDVKKLQDELKKLKEAQK